MMLLKQESRYGDVMIGLPDNTCDSEIEEVLKHVQNNITSSDNYEECLIKRFIKVGIKAEKITLKYFL